MRLLVDLDEQRSVMRAAAASNMTQPGASKLLRDLEEALGVPLFDRHPRGVEPTWYGEILVRRARLALAEIASAGEEIAALKSGLAGRVSIGAVVDPGTSLVPSAIAVLKQRHPNILVSVDVEPSSTLVRRLLERDIDVAIARLVDIADIGELAFDELANESHAVIARSGHPLAASRKVTLEHLVDLGWILPPEGSLIRKQINRMFVKRRLRPPRNLVETTSLPVIISLLQSTDMVAALQERTVWVHREARLLRTLVPRLAVRIEPFGIITLRSHTLSPGAMAMLDALREVAHSTYSGSRRGAAA